MVKRRIPTCSPSFPKFCEWLRRGTIVANCGRDMDSFILLLILLLIFAPPIATVMFRRSRAVWIPSALLLGLTFVVSITGDYEPSTGDGALGGNYDSLFTIIMLGFALFNLLVALLAYSMSQWRRASDSATPPPPDMLPRAAIHHGDAN
jgi:hypothetical protein